jgi:hypothetical protein
LVRLNEAAGDVTSPSDGHLDRRDDESGVHVRVDGPADDPVEVEVVVRAQVALPFACGVFSEVGDPGPFWAGRGEFTTHQIVMGGRAGLESLAGAGLDEHRLPGVVTTDPPPRAITHSMAASAGFIGEEPVAELEIVAMGVEHDVRHVGLVEFDIGDRVGGPALVRLAREIEDPARQRGGNPISGQLADERAHHFSGRFTYRRYAAAQHLVLLLAESDAFPRCSQLGVLRHGDTGLDAVFDIRDFEPAIEARLEDAEISGEVVRSEVRLAAAGDPDDVLTELLEKDLSISTSFQQHLAAPQRSDVTELAAGANSVRPRSSHPSSPSEVHHHPQKK